VAIRSKPLRTLWRHRARGRDPPSAPSACVAA
jgi:hypothetical protein